MTNRSDSVLVITTFVIAFFVFACHITVITPSPAALARTPALTPIYPSTPSPVPTTVDVPAVLKTNGFNLNTGLETECGSPCTIYVNPGHSMVTVLYANGVNLLIIPINSDSEVAGLVEDMTTEIYGPGIAAWIMEHLMDAKDQPQSHNFGGLEVQMDKRPSGLTADPVIRIIFIPLGNAEA